MASSPNTGVSALTIDPGQFADESLGSERERQLRALVSEHFDFIWRLLRRMGFSPEDADDAAQQVFMAATQKSERITRGSERTYLYGTALRVAANLRRKLARQRQEAEPLAHEIVDLSRQPDHAANLGEACSLVDELLRALPEELRRVLVLAQIEQFEISEIAEAEGIPVGTAASRLRRARTLFREQLERVRERNPFREGLP
ncbi:MAG: RNA polymerase sigma factor [Myxococcota bacterium]